MKRDIRKLFKEVEIQKTLPKNHREEFLSKLKQQNKSKPKSYYWIKYAAAIIVMVGLGYILKPDSISPSIVPNQFAEQLKSIEKTYLDDIDKEWNKFISLTNDQSLITRYQKHLENLSKDYKALTQNLKSNPNDIKTIEAIIINLQTRLQVLKDIQSHISLINLENEQHENSI